MRRCFDFAQSWPLAIAAALSGCAGGGPEPAADEALRRSFPDKAGEVLAQGQGWVGSEQGFAPVKAALAGSFRGFSIELPREAQGAVRLQMPDGREVRVRELAAFGEGAPAERAIAYRRPGGTSFWTAAPNGIEHWLHLDAGSSPAGEPVAAWEVTGAALEQRGEAVALLNEAGVALLWVTAPRAYASSGRPARAVGTRLSVEGARLSLWVDGAAEGEALLVDPLWSAVPSLVTARFYGHTATLLDNGQVLVAGGSSADGGSSVASAELFDPVANTWKAAGLMATPRVKHTATRLGNGQVLVAGGYANGGPALASVELFDPVTSTWTTAAGMRTGHVAHTATLLGSGKVLIVGGADEFDPANVELFDPVADTSTAAAPMATPRESHAAVLLDDGKVLVVAGLGADSSTVLASAELFDPVANTWTAAGSMAIAREPPEGVLLKNGKVLIAGGFVMGAGNPASELYDPKTNTWTAAGSLKNGRSRHSVTLLDSGKVLVAGGISEFMLAISAAEQFDPATNLWSTAGSMGTIHTAHTATRLKNGKVLVAAGFDGMNGTSAELFDPASGGLGIPCSLGEECLSAHCNNGICCATSCGEDLDVCHVGSVCQAPSGVCSVGPIKPDGTACPRGACANGACVERSTSSGSSPEEFGGCGCGVSSARQVAGWWLGLGLLLWARRRPLRGPRQLWP